MINVLLYNLVTWIYLLSTVLYLVNFYGTKKWISQSATVITIIALLIHVSAFIIRWIESYQLGIGHLPIRGPYECLTFSAAMIVLFYLFIEYRFKSQTFGIFSLPIVFLLMVFATLSSSISKQISPMPEILQGNYINYHLATCFVGYAAFTVSFVASVLFLLSNIDNSFTSKRIIPTRKVLDTVIYKMIAIGFIMFTILIVTGMFRTKIIWGSYWSWDGVENWSLITWLVYAVILHGRFTRGWSGRITAILSIIGFGLSIISFLTGAGFIFSSGHYPLRG
jgi:cytochrome c-type biogenesis protein CcsB